MQKFFTTTLAVCLTANFLFSQQTAPVNQHWCGSIEAMEANFKAHPELRQQFEAAQIELNAAQEASNSNTLKTATVNYTIPVVFHVLHQNGVENISDAQIKDQVAIFNRDYNLQNADTSVAIAPFKNIIGNIHFTFVLAKLDPNGNCTSGIDRFYDSKTLSWPGNIADYLYTWNPTQYLNFYVVKGIASGAAGYAYYPGSLGTGSAMDGIVILQDYVGSIGTSDVSHSRALTHEVGHWFNLQHTWGNTNNPGVACGNDQVNDTPVTQGFTACSTLAASQICNPGISENYQNYMDYSYCSVMFTIQQGIRMNAAANSSTGGRNNLGSPSNLAATGISPAAVCAPVANFQVNRQVICVGDVVNYTDISNVGTPTSWNWSFQGGTPSTSNVQNPSITYNTPGTYTVQLIAGNTAGNSAPEIKTNYITVLPTPITTFMSEGFETANLPNSTWSIKNSSSTNVNWAQTTLAAATGSNSAFVAESVYPSSTVELFSPTYNFNAMPGIALTLKWAGAERDATSTSSDVFTVMFSTNCGLTWAPRLTRNIKSTTSGVSGVVNGNFIPTPSQFKQEVIPVSSLATATNILFKLKFTAENGSSNNFYVDDINLSSVTALKETQQGLLNFNVFPSPAHENISVAFDLLEDKKVEILLLDVLGRTVKTIAPQTLGSGNHSITIPVNDLSKGIYFVKTDVDHMITTEKIIVE